MPSTEKTRNEFKLHIQENPQDEARPLIPQSENSESVRKVFCEILSAATFSGARSAFVAVHYSGIGYFMSQCGASSAAAASVVSPTIAFMAGITMGITSATGTNLGEALGEKNEKAVSEIIRTSWIVSIGLGIASGTVYLLFKPILPLCLNQSVADEASQFFMTYAAATIPEILTWNNGQIVFKVENMPFLSFVAAGMYRLPAVALSYYMGISLKLGPLGIGLGSAASGWLNALLTQPWFYTRETYKKYNLTEFTINNFASHLKKFWTSGWPLAFQRTSEWLNLLIIAQTAANWSQQDLLAIQTSLLLLIGSGLIQQGVGQGAMMQVVEDRKAMLKTFKELTQPSNDIEKINLIKSKVDKNYKQFLIGNMVSIVFSLLLAIVIYLCRDKIISLYAPSDGVEKETLDLANTLLLINCVSLPFDASRNVTAGILRGWNDLLFPTVISLMSMSILAMPVGISIGEKYNQSLLPLFIARIIGLIVSAGVNVHRFFEHRKQDQVLSKVTLNELTQSESIKDSELNDLLLHLVKNAKNDAEATTFVTAIVKYGAKPTSKDQTMTSRGWTALHWAAYKGYSNCITAILNAHDNLEMALSQKTAISFNRYARGNQTPLDIAKQYGKKETFELLSRYEHTNINVASISHTACP